MWTWDFGSLACEWFNVRRLRTIVKNHQIQHAAEERQKYTGWKITRKILKMSRLEKTSQKRLVGKKIICMISKKCKIPIIYLWAVVIKKIENNLGYL